MKVGVIGAGSFGCTIAKISSSKNNKVYLYTHTQEEAESLLMTRRNPYIEEMLIPEKIVISNDYSSIDQLDMICYVVPSNAVRNVTDKILSQLSNQIIVICSKGIEGETQKSIYEILHDDYKLSNPLVILSGPTHAEELALEKYTSIVSTSESKKARDRVQEVFSVDYLRVYTNSDIRGVEILGATKNVLAIAAGFCDSHPSLGDNTKALILTRGLRELKLIGELEGANSETFYGLTGMGDLIVTATSRHSRNRKFGELLGKGYSKDEAFSEIKMIVEGYYSVEGIYKMMVKNHLELPIISAIYKVLYEEKDIKNVIDDLLTRDLKHE